MEGVSVLVFKVGVLVHVEFLVWLGQSPIEILDAL